MAWYLVKHRDNFNLLCMLSFTYNGSPMNTYSMSGVEGGSLSAKIQLSTWHFVSGSHW